MDVTLAEAKDWLRDRVDHGERCPCCTQFAKVYRRKLSNAPARVMIAIYRRTEPGEYLFLPDLLDRMTGTPHQGGYGTLGHYWGLLEQQDGQREDGSNRVGWWRLTADGRAFVRGELRVPRYARLYDGRCLGFAGDPVSIREALGTRFNYDDLMGGL